MKFLVLLIALATVFAGCQKEIRDDETPTADSSEEMETSVDGPVEVSLAWVQDLDSASLDAEAKAIVDGWIAEPTVVRYFRDGDSYRALVAPDNAQKVVPALLLEIENDADAWKVTSIEPARSDLLWPQI